MTESDGIGHGKAWLLINRWGERLSAASTHGILNDQSLNKTKYIYKYIYIYIHICINTRLREVGHLSGVPKRGDYSIEHHHQSCPIDLPKLWSVEHGPWGITLFPDVRRSAGAYRARIKRRVCGWPSPLEERGNTRGNRKKKNSRVRRFPQLLVEEINQNGHGIKPLLIVELHEGVTAPPGAAGMVVVRAAVAAAEGAVPVRELADVHHLELLVAPRANVDLVVAAP